MSPRSSNELQHPDLEKTISVLVREGPTKIPQQKHTTTAAALDWDGPEDPDNPKTWSFRKRLFHSMVPGLFNFVV